MMESPQMRKLRYSQLSEAALQRDPSPEAAAEVEHRNARSTVYTSFSAYANAALNKMF